MRTGTAGISLGELFDKAAGEVCCGNLNVLGWSSVRVIFLKSEEMWL